MAGDSALKPNVSPAARARRLRKLNRETGDLGQSFVVIGGVRYLKPEAVQNGAFSSGASSFTAGSVAIAADPWTEVQRCSMTTAGGAVRVDFSAAFFAELGEVPDVDVQYRIKRDGAVIRTGLLVRAAGGYKALLQSVVPPVPPSTDFVLVKGKTVGTYSVFAIDAGLAAGSYMWSVEISQIAAGTVSARAMALMEIRK